MGQSRKLIDVKVDITRDQSYQFSWKATCRFPNAWTDELISNGANLSVVQDEHRSDRHSPLHYVAACGDVQALQRLRDAGLPGFSFSVTSDDGSTLLQTSLRGCKVDMAEFLISEGVAISDPSILRLVLSKRLPLSPTALQAIFSAHSPEAHFEALCSTPVSYVERGYEGQDVSAFIGHMHSTTTAQAVYRNCEIVESSFARPLATIDRWVSCGLSPTAVLLRLLMFAEDDIPESRLRSLLADGANPSEKLGGLTLLSAAVLWERTTTLSILLNTHGVDVNSELHSLPVRVCTQVYTSGSLAFEASTLIPFEPNSLGHAVPLLYAAIANSTSNDKCVKILLSAGADPNQNLDVSSPTSKSDLNEIVRTHPIALAMCSRSNPFTTDVESHRHSWFPTSRRRVLPSVKESIICELVSRGCHADPLLCFLSMIFDLPKAAMAIFTTFSSDRLSLCRLACLRENNLRPQNPFEFEGGVALHYAAKLGLKEMTDALLAVDGIIFNISNTPYPCSVAGIDPAAPGADARWLYESPTSLFPCVKPWRLAYESECVKARALHVLRAKDRRNRTALHVALANGHPEISLRLLHRWSVTEHGSLLIRPPATCFPLDARRMTFEGVIVNKSGLGAGFSEDTPVDPIALEGGVEHAILALGRLCEGVSFDRFREAAAFATIRYMWICKNDGANSPTSAACDATSVINETHEEVLDRAILFMRPVFASPEDKEAIISGLRVLEPISPTKAMVRLYRLHWWRTKWLYEAVMKAVVSARPFGKILGRLCASCYLPGIRLLFSWLPQCILLDAEKNINCVAEDAPATIHAIRGGSVETLQFLLSHGLDLRTRETAYGLHCEHPWSAAARSGNLEVLRVVTTTFPDVPEDVMEAALHVAVAHRNVDIVLELANLGAPVDVDVIFALLSPMRAYKWRIVSLHAKADAVSHATSALATYLPHVFRDTSASRYALAYLSVLGHDDIVARVCCSMPEDSAPQLPSTLFESLGGRGNLEALKGLWGKACVENLYVALNCARRASQWDVFDYLLEAAVAKDPSLSEGFGNFAHDVVKACGAAPLRYVQRWLTTLLTPVNFNRTDQKLMTPLAYASINGKKETVEWLLQGGATLKSSKRDPLELAIHNGHGDVAILIMSHAEEEAVESIMDTSRSMNLLEAAVCRGLVNAMEKIVSLCPIVLTWRTCEFSLGDYAAMMNQHDALLRLLMPPFVQRQYDEPEWLLLSPQRPAVTQTASGELSKNSSSDSDSWCSDTPEDISSGCYSLPGVFSLRVKSWTPYSSAHRCVPYTSWLPSALAPGDRKSTKSFMLVILLCAGKINEIRMRPWLWADGAAAELSVMSLAKSDPDLFKRVLEAGWDDGFDSLLHLTIIRVSDELSAAVARASLQAVSPLSDATSACQHLHDAAWLGKEETVRILVKSGNFSVTRKSQKDGLTPHQLALLNGKFHILPIFEATMDASVPEFLRSNPDYGARRQSAVVGSMYGNDVEVGLISWDSQVRISDPEVSIPQLGEPDGPLWDNAGQPSLPDYTPLNAVPLDTTAVHKHFTRYVAKPPNTDDVISSDLVFCEVPSAEYKAAGWFGSFVELHWADVDNLPPIREERMSDWSNLRKTSIKNLQNLWKTYRKHGRTSVKEIRDIFSSVMGTKGCDASELYPFVRYIVPSLRHSEGEPVDVERLQKLNLAQKEYMEQYYGQLPSYII